MKLLRNFDILDNLKENYGNKVVLARRDATGKWREYTVDEYYEHANAIAAALLELGVQKGDKVATIMQNRPAWNFLDMGITMAGCVHVPVYPTLSPTEYKYILNHSDAKFIFIASLATSLDKPFVSFIKADEEKKPTARL